MTHVTRSEREIQTTTIGEETENSFYTSDMIGEPTHFRESTLKHLGFFRKLRKGARLTKQ